MGNFFSKIGLLCCLMFSSVNVISALDDAHNESFMRRGVEPFLIPNDHPMKANLDNIFTRSRAIVNKKTFTKAGFVILKDELNSGILLAKHPDVPGFLFKVYLDNQTGKGGKPGWICLANRCSGAANIRALIQEENIQYFTAPEKFLYMIPDASPDLAHKQPVIMLVTDMNIVSESETASAWKNKITTEHLDELYSIISNGFGSSGLVKNVPYTKEGTFAFIDTEKPTKTPKFDKARLYFSRPMQAYWDELVKNGGPQPK